MAEAGQLSEDNLIQALKLVYDPRASNDDRKDATIFLDSAKEHPQALSHGFLLACDGDRDPILRHYGLSLMLFFLKYKYHGGQEPELREYVMRLTHSLSDSDPTYLKMKIAQIWTEVTKRIWGHGWDDMDSQLNDLWSRSATLQEFVLIVLETLSEDIYAREDYVANLRSDLGSTFARICLTAEVLEEQGQDEFTALRYGPEGWLLRLSQFLKPQLEQFSQSPNQQLQTLILRALNALSTICTWIPTKNIRTAHTIDSIGLAFATGDTAIRKAAMEVMVSVFGRTNVEADDMAQLLSPIYAQESIRLLHDAYSWARTSSPDEDDEKYGFAKKLSEVLACIGTQVEIDPEGLASTGNTNLFFTLFLEVTQHPSFLVSYPLLEVWLRLLKLKSPHLQEVVFSSMGQLLELCSSRAIKFDHLPEDSENASLQFLFMDCDTLAQREVIMNQYRHACLQTIETIVRRAPLEAIEHIMKEAVNYFETVNESTLAPENYYRPSPASLQSDAYFAAIEAGARGCLKWISVNVEARTEPATTQVEQQQHSLEAVFARWSSTALEFDIKDPDIKRKMIGQLCNISNKVLPLHSNIALTLLDHLLSIRSRQVNGSRAFNDVTKELLETCAFGAQRLGTAFSDQFINIYDQLETRIQQVITDEGSDLHPRWLPFLLMIIHRATGLDEATRMDKLKRMIQPIKDEWEKPALHEALQSYSTFCTYLGWDRLPEFLQRNNFYGVQDWADCQLDDAGLAFQTELLERNDQIPIKMTKALLHATTEKVEEGSPVFDISCAVWGEILPSILPNILKMLNYATAFHSMESWGGLSSDTQAVIKRILTDRFWQNGISAESRDAFVNKVNNTKNTFEGFGSTVRRTVRQIRTGSCDLVLFFSKLGDVFYGIPDLAPPLSQALYDGSTALSPHHFGVLINFSGNLVKGCPPHLREQFVPGMISLLYRQMRMKIENEWELMNQRTENKSSDDNLDEEMKNQSILRSMTYNGCYLLFSLTNTDGKHAEKDGTVTLYSIISQNGGVLEAILPFATAALRVRDFHSVKCTCTLLHDRLIPLYREPSPVHDFICEDILKAVISSLHEPYFADLQKELASLIVQIVHLDSQASFNVLTSLPGLSSQPDKVRRAIDRTRTCGSEKLGRAVVLDLLEQIRGVSIHEMGRIGGPRMKSRGDKRLLAQFDDAEHAQQQQAAAAVKNERGASPGLEGVAELLQ